MIKTILLSEILSLSELAQRASFLLSVAKSSVWLFKGVPGAGKTTLIKEMCKLLGVNEHICSPTFSLANNYQGRQSQIWHIDLYRLSTLEQAQNIGIEDMLFSSEPCFIEWPEIIFPILPSNFLIVEIEMLPDNAERRKIIVSEYEKRV